jgi:hypothetical protein
VLLALFYKLPAFCAAVNLVVFYRRERHAAGDAISHSFSPILRIRQKPLLAGLVKIKQAVHFNFMSQSPTAAALLFLHNSKSANFYQGPIRIFFA